jgi:hypothetical protein
MNALWRTARRTAAFITEFAAVIVLRMIGHLDQPRNAAV